MKNWTVGAAAEACGGIFYGDRDILDREIGGAVIDSRKLKEGDLFIAARGERVDGHSYITGAAEKGAVCSLGEKEPREDWIDNGYIRVEDSFRALREIAAAYRKLLPVMVAGITGSVGKTSTKEFIASVLEQSFRVWKTEGNFNNEIGLPLTVLQIKEWHEKAVLEMGISDFGEMSRLSRIARPDLCVLTNIGQCHLENLKSREGILRAKTEIFESMNPEGCVFLNGDDDMLASIGQVNGKKPVTFGLQASNDIYADHIVSKGLFGSEALIHTPQGEFTARIPLPGGHMVYNALAAAAVGLYCGMGLDRIADGIAAVQASGGRSHILQGNKSVIIDDCYNANPVSMRAAIGLLCTAEGHRTAILGDMFELGEEEEELHAQVGGYAVESGIDKLICVGGLSGRMYEGALEAQGRRREGGEGIECEVRYYPSLEELQRALGAGEEGFPAGGTILVKASHGMHFEELIQELLE